MMGGVMGLMIFVSCTLTRSCFSFCKLLLFLFFLLFEMEDLSLLSRNEPAPTVQHSNKDKKPPFWNGLTEPLGVPVVVVEDGLLLLSFD